MPLQPLNPTKTATVALTATGNTQLVAGVAGAVFTIVGYSMEATANVASTGGAVILVDLFDGASTALSAKHTFFAPNAAGTGGTNILSTGWIVVPYGAIRTTAGNALNGNLSAALSAGAVQLTVIYMQEV